MTTSLNGGRRLFIIMIKNLDVDGVDLGNTWMIPQYRRLFTKTKQVAFKSMLINSWKRRRWRFQLNKNKCKERRIGFSKSRDILEPIVKRRFMSVNWVPSILIQNETEVRSNMLVIHIF